MPKPKLRPHREEMNEKRAAAAAEVLDQFAMTFGEAPAGKLSEAETLAINEQNLSDLMADFAHYCDRQGLEMHEVLRRAKGHYEAETENKGKQFEEVHLG